MTRDYLTGRGETIFIVTLVMLCISFVAVCLRCYVRWRLVKAFGWDDGIMVIAMVLNIIFATCGIVGATRGIGRRFADLAHTDVETALFWWWIGQVAYVPTSIAVKTSIAGTLLRLAFRRIHHIILWTVIGVTVAFNSAFCFVLVLQCRPVSYFWNRLEKGTCIDFNSLLVVAYVYSISAALCDFAMGILPIALVRKLNMNARAKWALAGILSLGCVASVAVVIRIPFLKSYEDYDFLYATVQISIWSNVEASLGITAGSLTTLRPLFRSVKLGSIGSANFSRYSRSRSRSMRGPNVWLPDLNSPDPSVQSRQKKCQNNNISVNTNNHPSLVVKDNPEFWQYDQSSFGHTGDHMHPAMITTTVYSGSNRDEEDQDDGYLHFDCGSIRESEEESTPVNKGKEASGIHGFGYDDCGDSGCGGVKV